jgi:hypothetical protein
MNFGVQPTAKKRAAHDARHSTMITRNWSIRISILQRIPEQIETRNGGPLGI